MTEPSQQPGKSSGSMTATIIIGVAIGFGLAFGLFKLSSSRPSVSLLTTKEAPRSQGMAVEEITPAPTPTRIRFQYDQVRAAVGSPAPYFTLKDLNGNDVNFADFEGHPVIINLWATWCKPCEYEMPGLEAAYEKYRDSGLIVLGINATEKDDPQKVAEFVKLHKLTFPILQDKESYVSATLYGMQGLPMSFFIDSDGILRRIQIGAMLPEVVEKYTHEILPAR
jgi:thiol-disulfide isomerase/thioredoxin